MNENAKGLALRFSGFAFAAAVMVAAVPSQAQAQVTIPDVGFDVGAGITAMGTTVGGILGSVVLVAFALYAINYGVRKLRSYTGATK